MRKSLILLIVTLLSLISNNTFAQTFSGGSGTVGDPWQISTKADLNTIATYVNNNSNNFSGKYFIMLNDIDMSVSGNFEPIGRVTINTWGGVNQRYPFQGNFNGNGKIISNLTISSGIYIGLFGYISNATIENIGIDNTCSFNCPNHDLNWDTYYGGSLVAYSSNSTIKNSFSTANININGDGWAIGGLIGGSNGGIINNCYARASIIRISPNVIDNEWSNYYGGLIGQATNNYSLSNSYSAPSTFPTYDIYNGNRRSLIGNVNNSSNVVNSYYLPIPNTTNGEAGISRSLTEMRQQQFGIDLNSNSSCSMPIWEWTNGDYNINNGLPVLYWQGIGTQLPSLFLDGNGTASDPFLIRTIADMIKLSNCVNGGTPFTGMYFLLENNIVFNGSTDGFNPIGNSSNRSFQGIFNGGGHVISNLTISSGTYVGLFGNISGATIEEIGIEGFNITTTSNSSFGGALVAYAANSIINKCYSLASITGGGRDCKVGGLIGYANRDTINNCYSRATIINDGTNGTRYYGGLIGRLENNSIIMNSYSAPIFFANFGNRGSLVGGYNNSTQYNSYYLYISGMSNNPLGTSRDINTMKTMQFAIDLNSNSQCSMQVWEWTNGDNSINNGLPVLYWQGIGTPPPSTFLDGTGTDSDPFLIRTVADMIKLSNCVNGGTPFTGMYFLLENDIVFNGSTDGFNPIGNSSNRSFQGIFNGGGHEISNLTINTGTYVGLFGNITGATIKNVRIGGGSNISSNVNGYTGALVGYAVNSTIDSCNSTVNPSGNTGCRLGGLIGYANGCAINNCSSTATSNINTYPNGYYGGLVGYADNTTFYRCYSTAGISGSNNSKIGGLLGYITNNCLINECYSTGIININAYGYIGGLVGQSIGSQISKSYSSSSISSSNGSNNRVGGLVGSADNTIINNCYSKASITNMNGLGYVGGLIGDIENGSTVSNSYSAPLNFTTGNGTGGALYGYSNSNSYINSYYQDSWGNQSNGSSITPTDMKTLQFAIDLNSCQTNTWRNVENDYPVLYWQGTGAELPLCFEGSGTLEDPIRIRYAIDLIRISNIVAGGTTYSGQYLIVENDISFTTNPSRDSSQYFIPIGNRNYAFQGNFDGNGKVISNLTIDTTLQDIGLFGKVTNNATIKNLGIEGANITLRASSGTNNYHAAGLVGHIGDNSILCTISGCYVSSSTITGKGTKSTIAGLVGYAGKTKIDNCYSRANIIQGDNPGDNTNNFYGGLVGYINLSSTISNSYSSPLSFTTGTSNKGLLVGVRQDNTVTITNSYYDNTISSNGYNNIGIAKSRAQMRLQQFAIDLNPNSQCSMQVWEWTNGNYTINNGLPVLYWQGIGTSLSTAFLDGAGTFADPFLIRTVADMIKLSNCVNGGTPFTGMYFLLKNNIVFNGSTDGFNPIGYSGSRSFQGIFNGGGHIISNLTINSGNYVGLFGYISGATIDSLGIESCTFNSQRFGGGLCAYLESSTIKNCYSLASITSQNNNDGDYPQIGGLIGCSNNSTIKNCYARASIFHGATITYYYNPSYGGLIGQIANVNGSNITNCYSAPIFMPSTGTYFNSRDVGSLLGYCNSGYLSNLIFNNSYYLYIADVTSTTSNYGISKNSSELRSGCFVVTLNNSQSPVAWFKAKSQVNLGYPVLSWQKLSDNITPAGFEGNCLVTNDGSSTNPYQIKYVKDLIYISNMVANDTTYSGEYFKVLNDINYNNGVIDSSSLFNPIGVYSNNKPFSGNFNGQRFAIANYSFSDVTKDNVGLFGYIKNSTIQRLGISNFSIKAGNNVGGLVGNTDANSTLDTCFVYGFISGVSNVGGLVGNVITAACNINNSFTNTTIDAQTNVGGIAGNFKGAISNSYSNSEIYSSTSANDYVGGIIGYASNASDLTNVYSVCKIIRNGTNTNFGKIKGNNLGNNTNCFSRDSVFINYTNSNTTGYNGTSMNNAGLRNPTFATSTLGSANWKADYSPDRINDGYPILKYQLEATKVIDNGRWQATNKWSNGVPNPSRVVIIPNGKKIKILDDSYPMAAYVKIENGGTLLNNTNINFFGEYNRELYVGKWNLIGLSTYNRILSCLYNYADTTFKTFVKRFNYITNNWQASTNPNDNTVININTPFDYGEGFLVMPNYTLENSRIIKSRIISKGVLFNDSTSTRGNSNNALGFISLANNYPAGLSASSFVTANISNIPEQVRSGVQGRFIYVYDSDRGEWNNNNQSINPVTSIKTCEGFFIVSSGANGNFGFNRGQTDDASVTKNIIKSDLIYVKAFANDNVRESFLEFNEEANNEFDFEDGFMLFGSNYSSVEPYFTIPTPEINDSTLNLIKDAFSSLPYTTELDLRSQKNNEVTLNFSNIPSNIHVYLLDSLLRHAQYLNEEPDYNLQVSTGDNAKRLYVLFSYYKEDINEFFKPEPGEIIKIWNYNNTLNIEGRDLIRYELFDILGNKLFEEEIQDDKFNTQLDLGSGIYIVRAYSNTSSNVKKISISSK